MEWVQSDWYKDLWLVIIVLLVAKIWYMAWTGKY